MSKETWIAWLANLRQFGREEMVSKDLNDRLLTDVGARRPDDDGMQKDIEKLRRLGRTNC